MSGLQLPPEEALKAATSLGRVPALGANSLMKHRQRLALQSWPPWGARESEAQKSAGRSKQRAMSASPQMADQKGETEKTSVGWSCASGGKTPCYI